MTERMTPPSTRSAVPLIADANGLATNATSADTSKVEANRLSKEEGRAVLKNSCST